MPLDPKTDPRIERTVIPLPDVRGKPERRLKPVCASELGPPSPADYVLKGLLNRRDFVLLFGKAGCGKSLFAAHLFYRISQDVEFLYGRRVRGGPVLYVCLEGQGGFRQRIQALAQKYGPAANFYLIEQPINLINVEADAFVDELIEHANELGAVAIVVDTWAQATAGGDENQSEAGGRALASIAKLREKTGALVICVDHTGWGDEAQKRTRGWSGKWAASDAALRLDGNIKKGDVLVIPERLKDGTDHSPIAFGSEKVEMGIDEDGDLIANFRAVERDEAEITHLEKRKRRSRSLTPQQEGDLKIIYEAIAKHDELIERGGVKVASVARPLLKQALIDSERFGPVMVTESDAEGDAEKIKKDSGRVRTAFSKLLKSLADKGKIGYDTGSENGYVWSTMSADEE